jgi:hypothetical protein
LIPGVHTGKFSFRRACALFYCFSGEALKPERNTNLPFLRGSLVVLFRIREVTILVVESYLYEVFDLFFLGAIVPSLLLEGGWFLLLVAHRLPPWPILVRQISGALDGLTAGDLSLKPIPLKRRNPTSSLVAILQIGRNKVIRRRRSGFSEVPAALLQSR